MRLTETFEIGKERSMDDHRIICCNPVDDSPETALGLTERELLACAGHFAVGLIDLADNYPKSATQEAVYGDFALKGHLVA